LLATFLRRSFKRENSSASIRLLFPVCFLVVYSASISFKGGNSFLEAIFNFSLVVCLSDLRRESLLGANCLISTVLFPAITCSLPSPSLSRGYLEPSSFSIS
jgi:hypothetical protein